MARKRPEQRWIHAFLRDTRGATAIEYGILLMMVGLALLGIITMTEVTNTISNTFRHLADTMSR